LGGWRWASFLLVLGLAVVYVAIPVTGLLYKAGLAGSPQVWSAAVVGQHLRTVWRVRGGMVLESLVLAALAGAISAGLALIVCWLSYGARRFQWSVFLVLAVILASAGPVLGLGLKTTIAAILELNIRPLSQALYYGPSPVPALWAHCLRFMPYAVALLWPVMRLLPVELREAIRVDGGRPRHELAYLVWPLLRRATLGAALTVTVLSLGELGASKLVETPGSRTFAHEVFDQMHYGVGNDLAALCLILLGMVLLGGMAMGLFQMWSNRQANRP
jgi:iron(III) transport system permease protein